jgi:hypothetical protein
MQQIQNSKAVQSMIKFFCQYAAKRRDAVDHDERSAEELKLSVFCSTHAYLSTKTCPKADENKNAKGEIKTQKKNGMVPARCHGLVTLQAASAQELPTLCSAHLGTVLQVKKEILDRIPFGTF